jgi:hypothetical protein
VACLGRQAALLLQHCGAWCALAAAAALAAVAGLEVKLAMAAEGACECQQWQLLQAAGACKVRCCALQQQCLTGQASRANRC